ncbi:hypothetical protein [Lentzea sp. NPDC059081]|uniref:hypothetical protein n=1 Tax=Lentzea sp. NPDC059081 TaxID=3346719 RepID=UPI0036BC76B1
MRPRTTFAEVLVPQQTTLSIKVSVAPEAVRGLHAVVREHLENAPARKASRGGDVITNSLTGTVHGTVFQIGKVHGDVNRNG